jgi:D-amino-acid oxidase
VVEHTGLTMDAPAFLALLESELRASKASTLFPALQPKGSKSNGNHSYEQQPVAFIRATLQKLSDVFEYIPDTQLIINASGLGSALLQDVQDKTMYPVLGQTVLIKASQRMQSIPYCAMKVPKNPNFSARNTTFEDYEFTYVIPRAKSGNIICGGCARPDKYDTEIDMELAKRILQRCVQMVPQLLDDDVDPKLEDAWNSLTILKYGLGLRPAREDGMRIEMEQLTTSTNRSYHVLHATGAGSGGYQSGFGVTVEAAQKVIDFFDCN